MHSSAHAVTVVCVVSAGLAVLGGLAASRIPRLSE
jgi:hypothetical protein